MVAAACVGAGRLFLERLVEYDLGLLGRQFGALGRFFGTRHRALQPGYVTRAKPRCRCLAVATASGRAGRKREAKEKSREDSGFLHGPAKFAQSPSAGKLGYHSVVGKC